MKPRSRRTESEAGLHYWNSFNDCKRFFFFRYVMGWEPQFLEPPLLMGGAFHDGKARWYETGSAKAAVGEFRDSLRAGADRLHSSSDYQRIATRGETLLKLWIEKYGVDDLERFKILGVEKELEARLPNGFRITVRLDALVQDTEGRARILESKTGSFSYTLTETNVRVGDQATVQIYAVRQCLPKLNLTGVIPDIAYWNKGQQASEDSIIIKRADYVMRSSDDLRDFELYTQDTLIDIAQRTSAVLEGKYRPIEVFGRNTDWCFSYHRVCPFLDICRTRAGDNLKGTPVPPGFVRTHWKEKNDILDLVKPRSKSGSKRKPTSRKKGNTHGR